MVDKKFIGLDKPDITRFESYLPTAFSSELTLLQKVNKIIQDLNRSFDLTNEMVDYLNWFIEMFDEKLYETLEDVLNVWLEDGRLADIVRVAISEEVIEARTDYLGKKYVNLKERLDDERKEVILARDGAQTLGKRLDSEKAEVTTQLAQTNTQLSQTNAQLAQTNTQLSQTNAQLVQTKEEIDNKTQEINNQLYGGVINRRPLIVVESDDALIGDYTTLLPFLAIRNVPCTIAIPTNRNPDGTPTSLSWEQIHELVDTHGWGVTSHTHNNIRFTPTTPIDVIEEEFRLSKAELEKQGLNSNHFTYVGGEYDDRTMELSRKYFKSAATTDRNPGNHILPLRSQHLSRSSLFLTLEQLKADVDNAVHHKGLLIIYTHANEFAGNQGLQTKLSDIIAYAKTAGVEFVTREQAINQLGNIVETTTPDNQSVGLQITQTGQIYQNGEEMNSLSPEIRYFNWEPQKEATYVVRDLKGFPKSVHVTVDGGGVVAHSTGMATFDPNGLTNQFTTFTRTNGGTISAIDFVGCMADDNANQSRINVALDRYIKAVYCHFTKIGVGFTGSMSVKMMITY